MINWSENIEHAAIVAIIRQIELRTDFFGLGAFARPWPDKKRTISSAGKAVSGLGDLPPVAPNR
jgi:hypothetical protein